LAQGYSVRRITSADFFRLFLSGQAMTFELSIEFFPPQTAEGIEKLRATLTQLSVLKPAFFSVTYGAGGSTRERTLATVREIASAGYSAAPHLSCIGATQESIRG
jgi:methylenetetrahydrofolate reductase (NADPH)